MSGLAQLAPGSIFAGAFRVIRPLSEGGMGAVYVVEQTSTGTERALKIMHPQLVTDTRLRQRFVQEAKVGAMVESDHVVQVLDAGVDAASGIPWLTMELLKGETLASAIAARGPFSLAAMREIVSQLCHAIGAAHDVGLVHRDLKPENVFLATTRREGASALVKVLDFGIAKLVAEAQTSQTSAIGTPLWMAPEQTESDATIRPAADVWAIGLIVFNVLTGRMFWRAANVDNASAAALLREVILEPIGVASERAIEIGAAGRFPKELDAWFESCVVRDPLRRFADARAARRALEATLASIGIGGAPVAATDPSLATDATKRALAAPAEGDEPEATAPASSGAWIPAVIALAVFGLGIALVFFARPRTDVGSRPATGAATASASVSVPSKAAKLCPPGMVFVAGGNVYVPANATVATAPDVCLDATEVTVAAYEECEKHGTCGVPGASTDPFCNLGRKGHARHPMNCASFDDAVAYCRAMSKRLPTSAEWLRAAHGGAAATVFPWGNEASGGESCSGWPDRRDTSGTCEVASHATGAGALGVHDLVGNVSEWLDDAAPSDKPDARWLAGGSWMSTDLGFTSDAAGRLLAPMSTSAAEKRAGTIGFRCAAPPPETR